MECASPLARWIQSGRRLPHSKSKALERQAAVDHDDLIGAERKIAAGEGGDGATDVVGETPPAFAEAPAGKARSEALDRESAVHHDHLPSRKRKVTTSQGGNGQTDVGGRSPTWLNA